MAPAVASGLAEQVLAMPDEVAGEQACSNERRCSCCLMEAATTHLVRLVSWSRIPGAGQPICDACLVGRLGDCRYTSVYKSTHCLPPFHEFSGSLAIPAPVEEEDEWRWSSYSKGDDEDDSEARGEEEREELEGESNGVEDGPGHGSPGVPCCAERVDCGPAGSILKAGGLYS